MDIWGVTLTFSAGFFLLLALAMALSFEFVNGFHDTANAVATVIYTNTLKPTYAVIWSGIWNLIGALFSIFAIPILVPLIWSLFGWHGWKHELVAYSIVNLLPSDLMSGAVSNVGFAMVFSVLISAIIWNLGTWYLGLPASSSHTLIGAIMGVGIGNAVMNGHPWIEGLNTDKVYGVLLALLVSPIVGFVCSALLLLIAKKLIPSEDLFTAPKKDTPPPFWIRVLLVLTCTGVSFSHGSNDAQKGMGLIMVILFGILPGAFLLNMSNGPETISKLNTDSQALVAYFQPKAGATTLTKDEAVTEFKNFKKADVKDATDRTFAAIVVEATEVQGKIGSIKSWSEITPNDRQFIKKDLNQLSTALSKMTKAGMIKEERAKKDIGSFLSGVDESTKYIPAWVAILVALALGCGTMIGWKRIVVTVGEKIGKAHLTYAQGAAAEFTAMCTVFAADNYGQPVSTTHVLSSGIAGTMAANRSGLQTQTLINILLAWVLTLPVCIFLGASIFSLALVIVFRVFGVQ